MSDLEDQEPSDTYNANEANQKTIARLNTLAEIRSGNSTLSEAEQKEFLGAWITDNLKVMLIQKKSSESAS
jgi:hypothetical protein